MSRRFSPSIDPGGGAVTVSTDATPCIIDAPPPPVAPARHSAAMLGRPLIVSIAATNTAASPLAPTPSWRFDDISRSPEPPPQH